MTDTMPVDVRGTLLTVATRLFASQGFDRTPVQQIVTEAGVTKGALYHYFPSKDDLLYEIYADVLRMQTQRLEAFAAQDSSIVEKLRAAAADVVATTIANLQATTVFFQGWPMLGESKQRAIRQERRRYHEIVRDMIAEGQGTGLLRADMAPDLAVNFFFGAVHHLPQWYSPQGSLSATDVGDTFAELLMSALQPPMTGQAHATPRLSEWLTD